MNRIGKRHATRLMTMAYGHGVVRGQVENANLRAYSDNNNVTAAESIHTSPTIAFSGRSYVHFVQRMNDGVFPDETAVVAEVDRRNRKHFFLK